LGDNLDEITVLEFFIDPLDRSGMNSLEGIEQLYNAKNIDRIRISVSNIDTIDLSPLEQFTNVTELNLSIRGSSRLLPNLTAFKSLRILQIWDIIFEGPYTLNLPPGLTGLTLNGNKNLYNVDLSVIEALHDLHSIMIAGDFTKLPDLTKLESLRFIRVGSEYSGYSIATLESLEGIGAPNAEEIWITNQKKIISFAPLDNLLNLENLKIHTPGEGEYKLENLPSLKRLEISIDGKINLQGIENLTNLKHLQIGTDSTIDLQGIEKLQSLEHLALNYPEPTNIEGIGKLKNLKLLRIHLTTPEPTLEFLRDMPNLMHVGLSGTPRNGEVYQVLDLTPLATVKQLRWFDCNYFVIKNISALDGLESLCVSDEDFPARPFLWLEGSRLYDKTEKSRYTLWFENLSG
jgi:internalin A